jgi:hypothetical protein
MCYGVYKDEAFSVYQALFVAKLSGAVGFVWGKNGILVA